MDRFNPGYLERSCPERYWLMQNCGSGVVIQGTREWTDYQVTANVTPQMVASAGIAAGVQGMRRYYALLRCDDGKPCLIKALGGNTVLAETEFPWMFDGSHILSLEVVGARLRA